MAFFGVTSEEINEIKPHTNADRLELATLKGLDFQFVVLKGQFKTGDKVLYFPLDSLLTPAILEKLGLVGKLSGKDRNRVKTVRLRGETSQGLVSDLSIIAGIGKENPTTEEITAFLGVTKYEPPIIPCHSGLLVRLPEGQSVYDIEGCDRFPDVAKELIDVPVLISEKLEGSNLSLTQTKDGEIFVNQRNYSIQPVEGFEHDWWKVAKEQGLIDWVKKNFPNQHIVIYGEMIGPGIQGNYYGLKAHEVRIFDIWIDGNFLNGKDFLDVVKYREGLKTVPMISTSITLSEWLRNRSIKEASTGDSILAPGKLREGIVIRPMLDEMRNEKIGRLIVKQRSPEYLTGSEF